MKMPLISHTFPGSLWGNYCANMRQVSRVLFRVSPVFHPAGALRPRWLCTINTNGSVGPAQGEFVDPRIRILQSALKAVPTQGWTMQALADGAEAEGYPVIAHGMFPRGAAELVEYFMQAGNLSLSNTLSSATFGPDVPPNERIAFGVKARLEYIIPYIHSWPQAMALGLLPHNLPYTLTSLAHAVDEMWYFAGDKSHDMAWYSRRALLLTVYTSTELHLLTDKSEGYEATWSFLQRRLEDVDLFGKNAGEVRAVAGAVLTGINSVATSALPLVGPILSSVAAQAPSAAALASNSIQPLLASIPSLFVSPFGKRSG